MKITDPLIVFVRARRKSLGRELADHAGVGLRFVRELAQGKQTLRLDKVNQVLGLFGHRMEPVAYRMDLDDETG
jgi:predicted transcriptional regulator